MKVKLDMSSPAHMIVSHLRFLDSLLLRLFMAAFCFTPLCSAFKWFRRSAWSFWLCSKRVLYPIGAYVFPLRWLERSGGEPGELERSGGEPGELERIKKDPVELERNGGDAGELEGKSDDLVDLERNGGDPQKVEEFPPEGQHEAAAADAPTGKRAADSDRELAPKRPKFEEEEGEFDGEEYRVDPSEDWCSGYDSTWEAEEPPRGARRRARRPAARHYGRFESAARDMQHYRHDYPNPPQSHIRRQPFKQVSDDKPNLQFYLGNKCSEPDGVYINGFHQDWYGDYSALESVHSYIQWLFPLQEPGMNSEACTLTKEEIKEFCENDTAKANLLASYRLMLDFYGIDLCDENSGEVKRASNWRERFENLNFRTHNNLRITRILKCLGTLGYPHYQAPLVRFFLEETLVHGELPAVKDSVLGYFLFAVLDKEERKKLVKFAYLSYSPKEEFVWCPGKIQRIWSRGIGGGNEASELKRRPLSKYGDDEGRDEEET